MGCGLLFSFVTYLVDGGEPEVVEDWEIDVGDDGRPYDIGKVDHHILSSVHVVLRGDAEERDCRHEAGHEAKCHRECGHLSICEQVLLRIKGN